MFNLKNTFLTGLIFSKLKSRFCGSFGIIVSFLITYMKPAMLRCVCVCASPYIRGMCVCISVHPSDICAPLRTSTGYVSASPCICRM